MSCTVTFAEPAELQLAEIDAWWQEHRPAAPKLFVNELASAVDLLAAAPDIGQRFHRARVPGVRRFLLRRSKHFVYYVHDAGSAVVHILSIWSTSRGSDPRL